MLRHKKSSQIDDIENTPRIRCKSSKIVYLGILCQFFIQLNLLGHEKNNQISNPSNPRMVPPNSKELFEKTLCSVSPQKIIDFANGVESDFSQLLPFVTNSRCSNLSPKIIASIDRFGSNPAPYKLDAFLSPYLRSDLEGMRQTDLSLQKRINSFISQYPLGDRDLLPLIGQLAVLSPSTSVDLIAKRISGELIIGQALLKNADESTRNSLLVNISDRIMKMGATNDGILPALSRNVSEMATLAQAESLRNYFFTLAQTTSVAQELSKTFNVSAEALRKAFANAGKIYTIPQTEEMMALTLSSMDAAISTGLRLDLGVAELNQAMESLMSSRDRSWDNLKTFWKKSLLFLAEKPSLTALSQIVSMALTPELIFLSKEERDLLLIVAGKYPEIGFSIQEKFLMAWARFNGNRESGTLSERRYGQILERNLSPWASGILELGFDHISQVFLKTVVEEKLLSRDVIKQKFPAMVLLLLNRRDGLQSPVRASVSDFVESMTENVAVLWHLSTIQLPALWEWIESSGKERDLAEKTD